MAVIIRPDFAAARAARPEKEITSNELVAMPDIDLETSIAMVACLRRLEERGAIPAPFAKFS